MKLYNKFHASNQLRFSVIVITSTWIDTDTVTFAGFSSTFDRNLHFLCKDHVPNFLLLSVYHTDRTPPYVPVPEAITATEPVEWTWDNITRTAYCGVFPWTRG
ncbi:hypothetical protein AVEN_50002-1 [Araneus ventricosus]|uniref:Uncharacterized protein n=1 Tax=Araneus ventricosus TaxID=182803 RepID=A0A4Y2D0U7_ARAVE|nr:hypothetical protein AVEN_50002-1 [Araneus ventricosus]